MNLFDIAVARKLSGGGGGGGSSDFSTAEVTVNDVSEAQPIIWLCRAFSVNMGGADFRISTPTAQGSGTYTAILYYGQAELSVNDPGSYNISTTGNIDEMGEGSYLITGDCTITITAKEI